MPCPLKVGALGRKPFLVRKYFSLKCFNIVFEVYIRQDFCKVWPGPFSSSQARPGAGDETVVLTSIYSWLHADNKFDDDTFKQFSCVELRCELCISIRTWPSLPLAHPGYWILSKSCTYMKPSRYLENDMMSALFSINFLQFCGWEQPGKKRSPILIFCRRFLWLEATGLVYPASHTTRELAKGNRAVWNM